MSSSDSSSSLADPLMAAIARTPDDDEPRLVWADREGGERGELVVIQCALEKRDPPKTGKRVLRDRAERKRLRERERAIVLASDPRSRSSETGKAAPDFSGIDDVAKDVRYERGFPSCIAIDLPTFAKPGMVDDLFTRAPLLHALEHAGARGCSFDTMTEDAKEEVEFLNAVLAQLRPEHPLRSLSIRATIAIYDSFPADHSDPWTEEFGRDAMASLVKCEVLRDHLESIEMRAEDLVKDVVLSQLVQFRSLKSFRLSSAITLDDHEGLELLRALPTLTKPPMTSTLCGDALRDFLALPEIVRMQPAQASIHQDATLDDIALMTSSPALASVRSLHVLNVTDNILEALARSPFADRLESLTLNGEPGALTAATAVPRLLHELPFLEHLSISRALPEGSTDALKTALPSFYWWDS